MKLQIFSPDIVIRLFSLPKYKSDWEKVLTDAAIPWWTIRCLRSEKLKINKFSKNQNTFCTEPLSSSNDGRSKKEKKVVEALF